MEAYNGEELIAISLDIGTTAAGAAIVHCQNHQVPRIRCVNRWPGSQNSSKIPSVLLYNRNHEVQACGAEAIDEAMLDRAAVEGWEMAKHFKLHLHPDTMPPPSYEASIDSRSRVGAMINTPTAGSMSVPPLPFELTILQCYADFIRYLYNGTEAWFKSNMPDGDTIWGKLSAKFILVLSHPNSWSTTEQGFLKQAVHRAGVISERDASRIHFVTESEASVHFTLHHFGNESSQWLSPSSSFAVCDAGGSTTDICVYTVEAQTPKLRLREAKVSDCTQSGGIFVTEAGRRVIEEKLKGSKYAEKEYVDAMVNIFDTKSKLDVATSDKPCLVKFGLDRDSDLKYGVSRGRLTLTGDEVKKSFEPCVSTIIDRLSQQISGTNASSIILVGGWGESPYLRNRVKGHFENRGVKVVIVNEATKKAVAEGAAIFFCREAVVARATRFAFGSNRLVPCDEHPSQQGIRKVVIRPNGGKRFDDSWNQIVQQGEIIDAQSSKRSKKHHRQIKIDAHHPNVADQLRDFHTTLYAFTAPDGSGKSVDELYNGWCKDPQGVWYPGFEKVCSITADLSALAPSFPILINSTNGQQYSELYFNINVLFGGTSLTAYVSWKDKGVEQTGPAHVIPSRYHYD